MMMMMTNKNLAINALLLLLAATLLSTTCHAFAPRPVQSRSLSVATPCYSSLAQPQHHSSLLTHQVPNNTKPYRRARKKVLQRLKHRLYTTLSSVSLALWSSSSVSSTESTESSSLLLDDPLATWRLACSLQVNEHDLHLLASAPWMG